MSTTIRQEGRSPERATASSTKSQSNALAKRRSSFALLMIGLVIGLFVSVTLAITIGPVKIPFFTVWTIALQKIADLQIGEWTKPQEQIVWLVRFPRVLLAIFVGGGLASVGTTMQAIARNNMAGPYVLGISSGASVGATMAILFGAFSFLGPHAISASAFLGSLAAFALVFALARSGGRLSSKRLILSGIAVSYMFSAATSFFTYLAPDQGLRAVTFWMMGSVAGAKWADLTLPATALLIGMSYMVLQARSLNVLLMGEETAMTLGVDTNRLRKQLFVVVSLVTGVIVAASGTIGFVGLMMPHIVRLLVGSDHRRVLPVGVFVGAIFLIWVDVLARIVLAPQELPIGIITSMAGAPFFIWLMHRVKKG